MKKIIMTLMISYIHNAAMTQVADTTAYLRDSIVGKKSYYIGKPLRFLILDLKITPTFADTYVHYVPAMVKDTVNLARIDFEFYDFLKMINTPDPAPGLLIRFTPVKIPCIAFKPGSRLNFLGPWSNKKQEYFMQKTMVVTDIQLF